MPRFSLHYAGACCGARKGEVNEIIDVDASDESQAWELGDEQMNEKLWLYDGFERVKAYVEVAD